MVAPGFLDIAGLPASPGNLRRPAGAQQPRDPRHAVRRRGPGCRHRTVGRLVGRVDGAGPAGRRLARGRALVALGLCLRGSIRPRGGVGSRAKNARRRALGRGSGGLRRGRVGHARTGGCHGRVRRGPEPGGCGRRGRGRRRGPRPPGRLRPGRAPRPRSDAAVGAVSLPAVHRHQPRDPAGLCGARRLLLPLRPHAPGFPRLQRPGLRGRAPAGQPADAPGLAARRTVERPGRARGSR